MKNNFTFIVLTYNHKDFIIEHLESIKYQILEYGINKKVNVIIADDYSKDTTVEIATTWLKIHKDLFNKVDIISDGFNRGTCKNFFNAINYDASDYCKITAGDDVYSYENLFPEFQKIDQYDLISGLALNLLEGKIEKSNFMRFNIFATNIIYQNTNHLDRLKFINFFNAPSLVYSQKSLKNKNIKQFVEKYTVTEDYPFQIKMAEIYNPLKFFQVDKIFIYYRRTSQSTYIIKNTLFEKDKIDIFTYLIDNEEKFISKVLIKNRKFCFNLRNRYVKKLLNLNLYIYLLKVLLNLYSIFRKFNSVKINYARHQQHYELIKENADKFLFLENFR